ncbi:MAG: methylated-DNA--[protein]-cysteine S-methyltransferase [Bacteroidales bacterium]|nr:methylated-DNA--[protein]-cysteine S-methyltransferase [Bacteroidales bacterium]
MSVQEYNNLHLNYKFYTIKWGKVLLATSEKGLCALLFATSEEEAIDDLKRRYKNAILRSQSDAIQQKTIEILQNWDKSHQNIPKFHIKGSDFECKVWDKLLEIPYNQRVTYGQIAQQIGKSSACRAVGNAVGNNPISILIPCHRVIKATGELGNYRWGKTLKKELLQFEATEK